MRILWFSNILITNDKPSSSGTWIVSMLQELKKRPSIEICIIGIGNHRTITKIDYEDIEQWAIPNDKQDSKGLPSKKTINAIFQIVETFNPDVIHIWGVENYWGLLTSVINLNYKVLIEIQGLKAECTKVFYGGLFFTDLFCNIGLIEIMYPKSSVFLQKRLFESWGKLENKIICNHKYINTQSDWVRAHIKSINSNVKMFNTGIILRDEITNAQPWTKIIKTDYNQIFTVISNAPYKGLHITIRAFAELKKKYPNLILKIAGISVKKNNLKNSSYINYLKKIISELNVSDSIIWLGSLTAEQIVAEYYKTSVFVISSYVESYCLALAEALYVGVPSVVAYSSALPELATDNFSALYYPVGEYLICANKIERILIDKNLSITLSTNARKESLKRNNTKTVVENQIKIYNEIVRI